MKHYHLISVESQDALVYGGYDYTLEVFEASTDKVPCIKLEVETREVIVKALAFYLENYYFDNIIVSLSED